MSLKTSYAISAALDTAYQAGVDYIGTQLVPGAAYAALNAGLADAASYGKTTFTIAVDVTHAPNKLRLLGDYWASFSTGVIAALSAEGVYSQECTIELNTVDNLTTKIDFNFTF